jgi:hypothetical protein
MKKVSSLLAASLLVGGLTTAALAADASDPAASESASRVLTTPRGGTRMQEFKADQTLQGTINGIDQSKGSLLLKTDEGQNLLLSFPLDVLKHYKEGDHVVLNMALSKASGPLESMR